GGNDLMFPHHENEIAQSCCANDTAAMANVWLHNEMLQVEGKKMSKSLGNFFTVRDLLDQGVPGEVIRFVMLSTHYRKPMDWTEEKAREAERELRTWRDLANPADQTGTPAAEVLAALRDDLNTPQAITELRRMARSLKNTQADDVAAVTVNDFAASARMLGLLEDNATMGAWVFDGAVERDAAALMLEEFQTELADARETAKQTKDFSTVDRMKAMLVNAGVEVRMSKDGVELLPGPDFDPARLETL
ncbi:DALR domain-containing protein, partial [Citreimonas sp.]|uniref:DALR domain-containing protein n=1 Tax=Citreimonas sp. TaxID=3036715 RepID=UPI00405975CF